LKLFWRRKPKQQSDLPPEQAPIPGILRWGIDHPGITLKLPDIDKQNWRLTVDGDVENLLTLNWLDFLALPQIESISDFHCVEGWSVLNQRWGGVSFTTIQDKVKPKKEALYVWFDCSDGYTTSLPITDLQDQNVLLAHRLNDQELSQPLGGPMRLIIPKKYAYKSPMWLTKITFNTRDKLGFWERGYYSNSADVWRNDRYRTSA
jgi:DMSO/TMAO reductase YedYZ molybdopterin-dependent catalytic subunit